MSDIIEKRLFNSTVETIKYYRPIKPLTLIKFTYLWPARLSSLVGPPTNPNRIKKESYNENKYINNGVDIGHEVNHEVPWADELPPTNSSHTKSESHYDYCNMSNKMGDMISFTKEIQPNHSNLNYTKNKYHGDIIIDNNYNIRNKIGNKKLWLEI